MNVTIVVLLYVRGEKRVKGPQTGENVPFLFGSLVQLVMMFPCSMNANSTTALPNKHNLTLSNTAVVLIT